jgi:hypothetical protein
VTYTLQAEVPEPGSQALMHQNNNGLVFERIAIDITGTFLEGKEEIRTS